MIREFMAHCVKCDAHRVVVVNYETIKVSSGSDGPLQSRRVMIGPCPVCGESLGQEVGYQYAAKSATVPS